MAATSSPRKTTRSGNPATRAAAKKASESQEPVQVTSAKAWKKSSTAPTATADLRLPSGNVAKVRHISPEAFLAEGMIPDSLGPIIQKSINEKKGLPPQAVASIAQDPKKIAEALRLIDKAVAYAVVEPLVQMPPEDPSARSEDVVYTDEVDSTDKMFIFNWAVGGTADLEQFRGELGDAVASVPTGEDVEVPSV